MYTMTAMQPMDVFPGVQGVVIIQNEGAIVPMVEAVVPGSGAVGRFISALQAAHASVKFLNVVHPQLRAMLDRRGFRLEPEFVLEYGEWADNWVWRKA